MQTMEHYKQDKQCQHKHPQQLQSFFQEWNGLRHGGLRSSYACLSNEADYALQLPLEERGASTTTLRSDR